jgi:hypothetical protein
MKIELRSDMKSIYEEWGLSFDLNFTKKILSYVEQTALMTPYVRIEFLCIPF